MSIMYCKPPTNPDGSRKSYVQRRAERQQQDAERRLAQKGEPIIRDSIYNLPAHERSRLRHAEEQGRREGMERAAIEEAARKQVEYESIPEHLRRPENIFNRLIAEHEDFAYRPEVASRIKKFKKLAAEREKEIDAEMESKLRRYEAENNPETKPAFEHWERASASAETNEEKEQWARLKGLIDAGSADSYWDEVAPVMKAQLDKIQSDTINHAAKQAPLAKKQKCWPRKRKLRNTCKYCLQLSRSKTK